MFSLLLLSLALSAPSAAAQTAAASTSPIAPQSDRQLIVDPGLQIDESQPVTFDAMEIQPDGDTCFKIRAYVFSAGAAPKLLRETTCGPKRGALRSIDGTKPRLMPLDAGGDKVNGTQR